MTEGENDLGKTPQPPEQAIKNMKKALTHLDRGEIDEAIKALNIVSGRSEKSQGSGK